MTKGFRERTFTVHDFTGDGGGPRQSKFYSAASLEGKPVPAREWLVDELVPSKTVTLFSGDGGTGKSLLALQLAVAVAAGGVGSGARSSRGVSSCSRPRMTKTRCTGAWPK